MTRVKLREKRSYGQDPIMSLLSMYCSVVGKRYLALLLSVLRTINAIWSFDLAF